MKLEVAGPLAPSDCDTVMVGVAGVAVNVTAEQLIAPATQSHGPMVAGANPAANVTLTEPVPFGLQLPARLTGVSSSKTLGPLRLIADSVNTVLLSDTGPRVALINVFVPRDVNVMGEQVTAFDTQSQVALLGVAPPVKLRATFPVPLGLHEPVKVTGVPTSKLLG